MSRRLPDVVDSAGRRIRLGARWAVAAKGPYTKPISTRNW